MSTANNSTGEWAALLNAVRPELHRYCARLTGSVFDGEDIVQDTLERASMAVATLDPATPVRPWLFKIAHNRAMDHLRARKHRDAEPLDALGEAPELASPGPEDALMERQAVDSAVSRFAGLPPAQRSVVVLKDVIGYSLAEIAALLELSTPAVKAALHRGRRRLAQLNAAAEPATPAPPPSAQALRYAALFNAREWDSLRDMLADDVRMDQVSLARRSGRENVGTFFTNYARLHDWFLRPAWLEGREILAVFRDAAAAVPDYFMELQWRGDRIAYIRDFRHMRYIADRAPIALA